MRESRLWFTQTIREFRRACGKNLPHGLHGEGIVEAKTTESLMPAHRPCLRAVTEQNSGRTLNRRSERSTLTFMLDRGPRGSHGSDTRTAQKEAPDYSTGSTMAHALTTQKQPTYVQKSDGCHKKQLHPRTNKIQLNAQALELERS